MNQRRRKRHRRAQSRRKRQRNLILKLILFIILIIGIIAALFLWKKYSPTKERADLNEYYGIQNEGQLAIILNDEVMEPKGMISDGKAYVEYGFVRDNINARFYWDANENVLLYTLPGDVVRAEVGSTEYMVSKDKNSENYVILKTEGSTAYIALDFVQKYTNLEYEVYDNPSRVMIVNEWGSAQVAEVRKDTQVRWQGGVKSPVLTDISKQDEVKIIESVGSWRKVRTKDGFIGYVASSALKKQKTRSVARDFEEPVFTNISKEYKINLAWHNVTNAEANGTLLEMIAQTKGLNTIAPTWFHVVDTLGNLDSLATAEYVNYAHQSNIEVWATVRDFDGGINSTEESYELLRHTSSRENLTNQLVAAALQYGIDGINVDFEKISAECGEHYIQFIRELSVKCRQNGLVLSIDNYVPQEYNRQYDRKEQGIVADYIIVMGYDEYYGGSPAAGPVSSYSFVKEGIEKTLEEVPAEKVISGVPFFTRVWKETPKTAEELEAQAGTDAAEYSVNVESTAYSMAEAESIVAQAGAVPAWDEANGANYASWESEGSTYKIWLEDASSLGPKLQLIKDYGLAGSAAWRLGQEKQEIWDLILQYLN